MNKPSTLKAVFNAASSMFKDKSVISVVMLASFGFVKVYRNGMIIHTDDLD
jgi:hypothetical protein